MAIGSPPLVVDSNATARDRRVAVAPLSRLTQLLLSAHRAQLADLIATTKTAGVTLERVLAIGGAGLVAAGAFVLMVYGVAGLLTAARYFDAGGLYAIGGGLLLPGAALAVLFASTAIAGLGMAIRGDSRFRFLTISSGIAVLAWAGFAMGSRTGLDLAWLMAAGSGSGLLLVLGWWLIDA